MNILFASPEVVPFAKTGGLADVAGSLPKELAREGQAVKVILPFYKSVKNLDLSLKPKKIGSFAFLTYEDSGIEYVFVVNDKYYDRDALYGDKTGDYPDNYLRFSYYAKSIVEFALHSGFKPDIIHLNDWQTGLVPIYLKMENSPIKTLFTIHNIAYQGLFKNSVLKDISVPRDFYHINGIEYYNKISFLKAGIIYSTAISTVSKKYSEEILTTEFGCGMDGILKTRAHDLYGILNGVDYKDWDPRNDKYIAEKYGPETIGGKVFSKKDLINASGLLEDTIERPLIGVISRLAEQKGIDLLAEAARDIVNAGASIIILGTGDEKYNKICADLADEFPGRVASLIKFDNALAHKIEAGSDFFAMPSRYEPCGLNQLYSLRYGTLPIVRATGGLDDTITDLYADPENGNGIKFQDATKDALIEAVKRGIALYQKRDTWHSTLRRIMGLDYSWQRSATFYRELYSKLINK